MQAAGMCASSSTHLSSTNVKLAEALWHFAHAIPALLKCARTILNFMKPPPKHSTWAAFFPTNLKI
jgi:hypothetical protein